MDSTNITQTQCHIILQNEEDQKQSLNAKLQKYKKLLALITSLTIATTSIMITLYGRVVVNYFTDQLNILPALQVQKINYIYYVIAMITTLLLFTIFTMKSSLSIYNLNPYAFFSGSTIRILRPNIMGYLFLSMFICISLHSHINEEQHILQQAEYLVNLKNESSLITSSSLFKYLERSFPNDQAFSNFCRFINKISFCHRFSLYISASIVLLLIIQQVMAACVASVCLQISEKRRTAGLEEIFVVQINQTS